MLVRLRNLSGICFSAIPEKEGEKRTSVDESEGREKGDGKVTQLRMPTSTIEQSSLPSSDGSLPYSEGLGSLLGSLVGIEFGSTLGEGLDLTLGEELGTELGGSLGSLVGSELGSTLGEGLGSILGRRRRRDRRPGR